MPERQRLVDRLPNFQITLLDTWQQTAQVLQQVLRLANSEELRRTYFCEGVAELTELAQGNARRRENVLKAAKVMSAGAPLTLDPNVIRTVKPPSTFWAGVKTVIAWGVTGLLIVAGFYVGRASMSARSSGLTSTPTPAASVVADAPVIATPWSELPTPTVSAANPRLRGTATPVLVVDPPTPGPVPPPANLPCAIKGTWVSVGNQRLKMYYLPAHPLYANVAGGEWFCAEEDAVAAGFAAAPPSTISHAQPTVYNQAVLDARKPVTLKSLMTDVWWWKELHDRNPFDQTSSNFSGVWQYVWLDIWGTPDHIDKVLVVIRFPDEAVYDNKRNKQALERLLNNAFPEVALSGWVFQAFQQDSHLFEEIGRKTIGVESNVSVKQLIVYVTIAG